MFQTTSWLIANSYLYFRPRLTGLLRCLPLLWAPFPPPALRTSKSQPHITQNITISLPETITYLSNSQTSFQQEELLPVNLAIGAVCVKYYIPVCTPIVCLCISGPCRYMCVSILSQIPLPLDHVHRISFLFLWQGLIHHFTSHFLRVPRLDSNHITCTLLTFRALLLRLLSTFHPLVLHHK